MKYLKRLICWLIGHDSPRVGTPATDFTCKRCGWVPEYCVVSRWPQARHEGPLFPKIDWDAEPTCFQSMEWVTPKGRSVFQEWKVLSVRFVLSAAD